MAWKSKFLGVVIAGLLVCTAARAADDDAAVVRFLDDNAFVVARIDEAALDLKADAKWLISKLEASKIEPGDLETVRKEVGEKVDVAGQWTSKFRAAGGRRIYVVLGLVDLPDPGPFILVPLGVGANIEAIKALFPAHGFDKVEIVGNALLFGHGKTLERAKATVPQARPELAEAMGAVDAPVRVALIPSRAVREMIEKVAPNLPDELGGGPITIVSQGVKWAALGIKRPSENAADPSIRVVVQTRDAQSAQALLKLEKKAAEWAVENAKDAPFDVKAALQFVMPKVEGDRLTITFNSGQIDALITSVAVPAMTTARGRAMETVTESNARQIVAAFFVYASKHENKWPDTLDQIADDLGGAELLKRLTTGRPLGQAMSHLVYRKPAAPGKNAGETIVLYEEFPAGVKPQRLVAAFADGHVELLEREEFKKQLDAKK